jgi:two-component system response regulator MtrA
MPARILLIEDDPELGAQVLDHLRRAGFEATWWRHGRELSREDVQDVALVLLDLMLPGAHGLDVLKKLRETAEVPVLVLSARTDTADKIRALKLGADDYMTKPFWPEELLERVRARLRRPLLARGDVLEVGALRVDLERREVRLGERPVELTRVELELLAALARRPGVAVTRRWLADHVLSGEHDGHERTLDVHISRIRKKLGDPTRIETVWGIGYRLAAGPGK